VSPFFSRIWITLCLCSVFAVQSGIVSSFAETSSTIIRQSNHLEKITLQLKWKHQFQFAGYYAAIQQGYYRDEGLDVTLIELQQGSSPVEQVLSGKADYGVADSEVVMERLQGHPVVAMAALFQHSPHILITRLNRGIYRPQDLVGRTVMVADKPGDFEVRAMLLQQVGGENKVKLIRHSWNLDDLMSGKADAMSAYYTFEPALMRARGVEPGIMRAMDYGIDFYGDILFTDEDEIAHHPERAAAFLRATKKGWRYAFDHSAEVISSIMELPGVRERGITESQLHFEADTMLHLVMPNLVEIGHMSQERWQRIAEICKKFNPELAQGNLDGFLYDVPSTNLDQRILRWVGIGAGGVMAMAIFSAVWMLQMRRLVRRRTHELALQNEQLNRQSTALRLSEESYRALFNISNDAIIVHDAETFRILDVNDRACEVFACERQEIIGRIVPYLKRGEDVARERASISRMQKALAEGSFISEWHSVGKNGHVIWFEASIKPGAINGRQRIIALVRDITERKRAEEERLKASKMDALGIMAGGIAHDLNNIMLGIILNLDLLLQKNNLQPEGVSLIHAARNATLRASDLSRRLLTFSKGGDPVKKMVDIKEIVLNALNLSLRGSNLLGKIQFEPHLPHIMADPGQIAQVIDNLVINAREACPQGGLLIVRGRQCHLTADANPNLPPGDYLEIEIADQGNGIPAQIVHKIFDPYFTTKKTGNGIGLTTCYSIIRKHGGDITVRSILGEGSTFTLYIPIVSAEEKALAQPEIKSEKRSGRILIIDDDELIRSTLCQLLKVFNHQAHAVESGEKGLVDYDRALEAGRPYDVVLLDGTIPGCLGGEAAFQALREIDPKVRVVLSTGYSNTGSATHWKEIGFCGILPKPFSAQQLDDLLQEILREGAFV
jgi:two-component system, cell cycle sensor histidine kinase and response regulator CckA